MNRVGAQTPAFRPRFVRLLTALFALVVGLGYFAALSHMAFVAHAACAEHGKLVHVQEGGRSADDPSLLAGDVPREVSVVPGEAPQSDEHDHCVIGVGRSTDVQIASPAGELVPHDQAEATAPLADPLPFTAAAPLAPPIPLLLLSPKSSPPV